MNKLIIIKVLLLLIITSCSINKGLSGTYYKKGKDLTYKVVLNRDSTFMLFHSSFGFNSKCQGKWHTVSKTVINLKCNSGDLIDAISSGDLSDREFRIMIHEGSKMKFRMPF